MTERIEPFEQSVLVSISPPALEVATDFCRLQKESLIEQKSFAEAASWRDEEKLLLRALASTAIKQLTDDSGADDKPRNWIIDFRLLQE